MPGWCSEYSCSNERTVENRNHGITFHKFPKDKDVRKKWEVALRREGFTASDYSVVCSEHFKQADFDRTGQIVRLRDGVIPSLFSFPFHLQKLVKGRATSTSRSAEESLSVASKDSPEMAASHPQPQPNDDHGYALPASPTALKTKINEHLARVESLERDKKKREKRVKTTVKGLLGDLRENNLINEELSEKLAFYSDLKMDFAAKQGHEYIQDCREFSLTLHLHGPKAYKYIKHNAFSGFPTCSRRGRWLRSVDAKPGLNKIMLDMLERRCQGDPAKYESVSLMLDAMSIKKHVQYNPHTESMSVTMATGKRRATCFNNIELEMLMHAYGEFQHVFRKKSNTAAAAKERETAWENIASRVNACNPAGEKRTWQQLKMKYKNIVQTAKRKKADSSKTGGGPAPPPLTQAEELALSHNTGRPVAEGIPGGSSSSECTPQDTNSDGAICLITVCLTMDGHASNVSMCNQLGCELKGDPREPLQTSFPHPVIGEKVFVMMDAWHMLKLACNMLQAYSPIATTTGQIHWRYINRLHDLQKDGLHAANTITDKHVYF
ncbi:DNA transposase THAP9 [Merluccius polli]|uniref:DNA transposase THAP9 n=1 Tax=Merluccius polli TaxID=89951 RepID=A0AA47NY79_MERPO|nr:DNA transposase THAP9 [Merluccius polli]